MTATFYPSKKRLKSLLKLFKKFVAMVAAAMLALSLSYMCAYAFYYPNKYLSVIKEAGYGDGAFVLAIIRAESDFNERAQSDKGAVGLMQIKPATAEFIRAEYSLPDGNLTDGEYNIKVGCSYLKYLSRKFFGAEAIAAAYNAGEGRVRQWLKDKKFSADGVTLITTPFSETNAYIFRVKKFYKFYNFFIKNT